MPVAFNRRVCRSSFFYFLIIYLYFNFDKCLSANLTTQQQQNHAQRKSSVLFSFFLYFLFLLIDCHFRMPLTFLFARISTATAEKQSKISSNVLSKEGINACWSMIILEKYCFFIQCLQQNRFYLKEPRRRRRRRVHHLLDVCLFLISALFAEMQPPLL